MRSTYFISAYLLMQKIRIESCLSIFSDASSLYYPPLNWIPFKYDIIFVNWIQLCWKKLNWICKYYILCVGCGFELCIYVYGISNAALIWIIKTYFENHLLPQLASRSALRDKSWRETIFKIMAERIKVSICNVLVSNSIYKISSC